MAKTKQLKVTLVSSANGRIKSHRETVKSLGLSCINSSVVVTDNPAMRGMINRVNYLVKVEEA